jgi:hypothetical protein
MASIRRICTFQLFIIFICTNFISCNFNNSNQKIDNLIAFSKLYGYVRYFHPSDEAANTDWDAFVVSGVERVKKARDNEELKVILRDLFYPIAPTIQIYNSDENSKIPEYPTDSTGLKKIFWQHYGLGNTNPRNWYKSIRTNRVLEYSNNSFLCYSELNDAEFQNCEIQFNLKLRTEFLNNESFFVIGFKGKNFQDEKTDTVFANGIYDASVKLSVEKNASPLNIGFQFVGQGKVIVDDAKISIKRGNIIKSISIPNAGFEEYNSSREPKDWEVFGDFYDYKANNINPISGKSSFEIISQNNNIKGAIFDSFPKENEYFDKELIAGLKCRVPLVLWSDSTKSDNMNDTTNDLPQNREFNLNNENTRLADVIITWNIIQHFFPYFEYLKVDWAEQQRISLEKAIKDVSSDDFKKILVNMLEPLKDGHVNVYNDEYAETGVLPFIAEWIENKAVVTKSAILTFKRGDIITKVNEKAILDVIKEQEKFISGSPQLKRTRCLTLGGLAEGNVGATTIVSIERDGKFISVNVNLKSIETIQNLKTNNFKPVRELKDGIHYIDLGSASMDDVEMNLDNLKQAKGLIIDVREYPINDIFGLFSYLTDTVINSPSWYIPAIIYPDRENLKFEFSNWQIHPKQPFLKCKKIFIFDSGAFSAGETLSSLIKFNKLGITIGQPTAGTNGNINTFELPGNISVIFTGMKVLNADSSQHYIRGVQPDIFVNKTIKGVKEGKDEYIDKAIELLME